MWYNRTIISILLVGFAGCIADAYGEAPVIGKAFPDLAEFGLEGELPDISSAKVVIVDFWASWCPPCKASFPVFDELQQEFGGNGLVVIAVSVDQKIKAMEAFLKRAKPTFSIVRDAEQKLVREVSVPAMPTSYVIDGQGVLRFIHEGFHGEKSEKQYREEISALLNEQA